MTPTAIRLPAAEQSLPGGAAGRGPSASVSRRFRPLWVCGCAALFLLASLPGCRRRNLLDCPEGNRVAAKALEPRLLFDGKETDAYLKAFPQGKYRVSKVMGVGRFYIDSNPALVKRHLAAGIPWEPHVLEQFSRHVVPGSTALDIGAHIGSLTVPLARAVGKQGMVYAFEPQKRIYRELVHNLKLNHIDNVKPLRFAVGARNEVIEMNPTAVFDGRTKVGKGGDRAELRTVDSFGFCNVSLIKIDVEGFEVEVLKGAERTIRTWHPVLVLEIELAHLYHQLPPREKARVDEAKRLLGRYGYEYRQIKKDMHDFVAHFAGE
jgi:FkbM family methyltransferase